MNLIQMINFLFSENTIKIRFEDKVDYYSKNDLIIKNSGYFENIKYFKNFTREGVYLNMKSKTFKIWRDLFEKGKTKKSINFTNLNEIFIARDFLILKEEESEKHYKFIATSLIKSLKKPADFNNISDEDIESLILQRVFPDNLQFKFENDIAYLEDTKSNLSLHNLEKLQNLHFKRILFFDCKIISKFELFKPEYVRFLDICIRCYNIDEIVVLDGDFTINFKQKLNLLSGIKKVTYPAYIMHRNNSSFTETSNFRDSNNIRDFRVVTRTIDIDLFKNNDLPPSAKSIDFKPRKQWAGLIGILKLKRVFRSRIN